VTDDDVDFVAFRVTPGVDAPTERLGVDPQIADDELRRGSRRL
jgi:hypothetical protein